MHTSSKIRVQNIKAPAKLLFLQTSFQRWKLSKIAKDQNFDKVLQNSPKS